jgi:hypothetical protein
MEPIWFYIWAHNYHVYFIKRPIKFSRIHIVNNFATHNRALQTFQWKMLFQYKSKKQTS